MVGMAAPWLNDDSDTVRHVSGSPCRGFPAVGTYDGSVASLSHSRSGNLPGIGRYRTFVSDNPRDLASFRQPGIIECEVPGRPADAAPAAKATTATADEKPDRAGTWLAPPAARISQFQAGPYQRRIALAHEIAGGRTARSAQARPQNITPPTPFLKDYPL